MIWQICASLLVLTTIVLALTWSDFHYGWRDKLQSWLCVAFLAEVIVGVLALIWWK